MDTTEPKLTSEECEIRDHPVHPIQLLRARDLGYKKGYADGLRDGMEIADDDTSSDYGRNPGSSDLPGRSLEG